MQSQERESDLFTDMGYHCSDIGNTDRLFDRFGSALRYSYTRKKFIRWNGQYWQWDDGAYVIFLAKETVKCIYKEAANASDENRRKELVQHGLKSESNRSIFAMVDLVKSERGIPIDLSELDTDTWLLNCINGTINLQTGELQSHNPTDNITRMIDVIYDPEASCPRWMEFLGQVTGNDCDLQNYLQKAIGNSLTGDCRKQVLFFLYGLGNNGKSTFLSTIRKLLGNYAQRAATDTFLLKDKNSNGPKESLADLKGKRFVTSSELDDGRRLAVSLIKDLTGGETIKADRKYEHEFEFSPTFKIFLCGNHKPTISDTTLSIWRRLKLIPFTVTINPKDQDDTLAAKLEAEFPGILAWAVQGCLEWQKSGLNEPSAVTTATSNYRNESDILHDFLDDTCILESRATTSKTDLREAYENWEKENHQDAVSQRTFRNKLLEKGITDFKGTAGKRYWSGIRLHSNDDE